MKMYFIEDSVLYVFLSDMYQGNTCFHFVAITVLGQFECRRTLRNYCFKRFFDIKMLRCKRKFLLFIYMCPFNFC